ncbi:hypothetical protein RclHR1_00020009 [Rhizophagus clarus]|uniref:Integrase catalytic domain-containing protein n=1 Tax=Rhizophagus clarus TaxID=94130 RepID=A0A2Z6RIV4_9GLOM|nr:hypothetical protein RclHR1_00020009 [Rhizophagus clarus]
MPYDKVGRVTYLFYLNPIGATSVKNRPKLLITDKGSEFKGECERLIKRHGVEIQKAMSKRSVAIVERYNLTLATKRLFCIQNAHDLSLAGGWISPHTLGKSCACVKNLPIIVEDINNSVTRLRYVLYLLENGELEGGPKRRGTDMNWSPEVYIIEEALIQKNKPVLYKLFNGPEFRFVREELLLVNDGVELPPESILSQ